MELFIVPFAGSFAAHVALLEAGLPHTIRVLDRRTQQLDDGRDYRVLTPNATVPAIALSDKTVLSESSAVLQYIADTAPEAGLAPRNGTRERYQLMEWLNFISTELHKKHLWPIFSRKTTPEMKTFARASLPTMLDLVERHLSTREHLLGDAFTVADAYLFWCLFVAPHGGVPIEKWPTLTAYVARIRERPSVARAFAIEAPLYAKEQAALAAA